MQIKRLIGLWAVVALTFGFAAGSVFADDSSQSDKSSHNEKKDGDQSSGPFKPEQVKSDGSVTVHGSTVSYQAIAGTLIVHPRGWDDVPRKDDGGKDDKSDKNPTAVASMFYVAYFKHGENAGARPVTFIFNGGPGSSTVWLHMGAFGPRRVLTAEDSHTLAAPYGFINNDESLLDASDLVFIDMPAAGFSRIAGEGKEKAFFGIDEDAYAFSEFITQFLSKYGRWNSPKYLFGESYGTTRAAVLINMLENRAVDFNGVIMLSQILCFDLSPDGPQFNPSVDLPYQLVLPTYAASAWYHHKLPNKPPALESFLQEVEHFAMTDYAIALGAGSALSTDQRQATAQKLHDYTGLPVDYILKADLRINVGEFDKMLQDASGMTTGRLDTRFSGPTIDPLSKESDYDPQSAAISSAYVSVFNNYVRQELKYGEGVAFRPNAYALIGDKWDILHQPPGTGSPIPQSTNVMPDLANAMKINPTLKIQLNAGYYDLATPFFEGIYEMQHLQIPPQLQKNIEYQFYPSGHMVYAHKQSLKTLHDSVADFIRRTSNTKGK